MTCCHHVHALLHGLFHHFFFALFYGKLRVNFISRSAAIWLRYVVLCDRCSSVSSASARISVSTHCCLATSWAAFVTVRARSPIHCRRGNATMCTACTVERHVISSNIKIFIEKHRNAFTVNLCRQAAVTPTLIYP